MTDRNRPDFLGIGPGKSGTTWLFRILDEHPDVGLAASKETLYFTTEFHRGEDWYANLFRNCSDSKAIGEISNTYLFHPEAAGRIHTFNPRMKLISCLRNPIDRAFSHYLFLLRNGEISGSFEDLISQSNDLIDRGHYSRHLDPYTKLFTEDQMLLLVFDDLKSDPEIVARDVYAFLGVDENLRPASLYTKAMPASRPRSRLVSRLVKKLAVAVRRAGHPAIVHRIKESSVAHLLYRNIPADKYPALSDITRQQLQETFSADVRRLSALTGRDLETLWFS